MEMTAVVKALESLPPQQLSVHTDCHSLRTMIRNINRDLSRCGKTDIPKGVNDRDIRLRLVEQLKRHDVTAKVVQGHNGHYWNELAHYTAREEAGRGR